jgi:Concanavalin A-like lectin/glucanases superfamily/Ig-like domain CHU_C associated
MKKLFTLIAILFFFLSPLISEASHFRYGHITWTRVPGTRDVTFTVTTAWRYDFSETVSLDFGDGTSSGSVIGTEILYVPNDYRVFQAQVTHTYANDGPFTVSFGSCCRISTLQNGADQSFTVSTVVCLNNNNLGSPVSTSPVVIEMNAGVANQYQLNTSEPDGSPITYSTTAISGLSYVPSVGGNVASVSSSGLITWNTMGAASGQLYQMKISLSDGCSKSETDFIIKIVACTSTPASAVISGTPTINLGQSANLSLTFNGASPWTYRLSGTTTDITTSTSPTTVSVTPTLVGPNVYTLSSVSNICGVGSVSGSGIVTVNPLLVACYPFNGNAQDSKGGHDGTVSGASLTTDRSGNANSAYSFDGSNSFIQLNNPDDFKNNTYTYSAWVNPSVLPISGEFQSIIGIGGGQVLGFGYTTGPAWAMTSYYNSSPPVYDVTPASTVNATANVWHQVTVVRNSYQVKIYVDGNLVITSSSSGTTIPTYTNSNPSVVYRATIGTRPDLNNIQFFNGKIDDVKIYNGVLNDNQVKALYLAEQSCPAVESSVLAVTSLTSSPACVGGNVTVSVLTNNITPNAVNPIIIQLSDVTGSFTNPIQIGSGITTTIACAIPNNLTGGKYKVRAVYGTSPNQVISVNALSLTLNPRITLIPTISTPNTTICNTNSITIASSGCSTNTYIWTGGLTGSSITVTPSSTKSYKVVCSAPPCLGDSSTAVTITVIPKPATPTITTPNTTICSGVSQVLSATGCAGGTYTWTGGLTGSSVTVSPTTTRPYKTVCTISNCPSDSSATVVITVNPKPAMPSISTPNASICNGGSTILTGSGCVGGSYTWSTGLVSASISVSPTATKSYRVVCRINGCASDSSTAFTVNVIPKPGFPTISANNTTVCSGANTILTASGCLSGTYAWTGGLTGSSITVAPTATRSYKAVCIVNSCSSDSSAATTITVTSSVANPITTPASVCEGNSLIAGNGLKSTVPNCTSTGNSATASYAGGVVGYDANLSSGSNPIATTAGIAGTITKVVVSVTWIKKGGGDQNSCGTAHNGADPSLAEMSLKLQAPDGTQVMLVPSTTYQGAYVGSITTTFDDASTVALSSTPFAGAVKPSGLLSALNGKSPNGGWTLIPNDNGGGDPLCVLGFSVTVTTTATPSASTITWWDAQTGGNQVGTGAEYLPATSTLAAGTYTYYAQANCTGSVCPSARVSAVLTVNARLSTPSITPTNSTICTGVSVILTASGCATGSTYAWTGGLSGSSVSVSPSVTKSYKVACSLNNCTSDSSAVSTITVATSMYSIVSGKWDLATTWSCGRVPTGNDDVTINVGHTVTVRDALARAKNLNNKGELIFANSTSKLSFGNAPVLPTNFALILQPGLTDGKDADVNSFVPTANAGNGTSMDPWGWTQGGVINIKRCFVGFDLSSIPTNAIVDSAYFSLYFSQTFLNTYPGFVTGHVGDNSLFIKRITSAWTESGITWNTQPTTSDINQLLIPAATTERQDYQRMNVKNMVADMVLNPVMSHGFMIRHQTEDPYKITVLTTSEDPTPSIRPKLQIYYHLP